MAAVSRLVFFEIEIFSCAYGRSISYHTDAVAAEPSFGDVVLVVGDGDAVTNTHHVQQVQVAVVLATNQHTDSLVKP